MMVEWSKKAEEQISDAIAARAHGGTSINWSIGLYAFMESAAMYLRDWPSVIKAVHAAREGRDEEAANLLEESDAEIQQIASLWSPTMHYVTICDLIEDHPDSDLTLDGPYCGAFFSTDPETPFVGLVFKGTHPESWSEVLVDLHYLPIHATKGHLWETHVSRGVYTTLFDKFAKLEGQTPFDYIKDALFAIASGLHSEAQIDVHITGHSLGASYATLFYAELVRLYQNNPDDPVFNLPVRLTPRDLYTFGSPRVALEDFTDVFAMAMDMHDGSSWRIVSAGDPVTLVPPVLVTDAKFIHLDKGYQVCENAPPEEMKSERNSHPRPPIPMITNMTYHRSQLSQLKSALSQAGLSRQQQNGKKRKRTPLDEKEKEKKAAKLQEIQRKMNPFDTKVTKLKHDVGGRKITGVTGKPAQSKQAGIEQRKKTLLKELQDRDRAGGIIDRRFGENDPTMTPEERMLERFTRERQRASKGEAFNLEDEDELTHYGQSLSKLDDFDNVGLGFDEEEEEEQIDKRTVQRSHFGGFDDEEEDDDEDGQPERKKSKAEVMAEVVAKSKEHKFMRQAQQEEDENLRHELDQELDSLRSLLYAADPGATAEPVGEDAPEAESHPTTTLNVEDRHEDKEYDQFVRELAFEKRAKPKDRTKTEEELAKEEKEALEKAERRRIRRMNGEEDENDSDEEGAGKKKRRQRGGR
ncbi:hypothetical protein NM688_g1821 [Phlebia brevispora]|uniref:Uncharacterized protein n=1 Tax=Phlebia brevispora TaxID=194682 RepID=A0ACC1TAL8_9APHY|nr:hypothetical protein NM688_g1821 [Phlebia brevispora]